MQIPWPGLRLFTSTFDLLPPVPLPLVQHYVLAPRKPQSALPPAADAQVLLTAWLVLPPALPHEPLYTVKAQLQYRLLSEAFFDSVG